MVGALEIIVKKHPVEDKNESQLRPNPVCFVIAAIDYIHFLHKEKKKQEEEVSVLRKEVMALKIMKT